jgi:hypothetical protein
LKALTISLIALKSPVANCLKPWRRRIGGLKTIILVYVQKIGPVTWNGVVKKDYESKKGGRRRGRLEEELTGRRRILIRRILLIRMRMITIRVRMRINGVGKLWMQVWMRMIKIRVVNVRMRSNGGRRNELVKKKSKVHQLHQLRGGEGRTNYVNTKNKQFAKLKYD